MKAGDKVIINPHIEVGTWNSKHTCTFNDRMYKPGVFILPEPTFSDGTFFIGDYYYDEEWLLPVPLFQVGDTVRIKDGLNTRDGYPYGVASDMEDMAGKEFTIKSVKVGDRTLELRIGDDGCLYRLEEDTYSFSWSSPMFDLNNYLTFKALKHESRLQDKEAPFGGASGKITSGIRSRKHKPRVAVNPLGYKKVLGRG